MDVKVEWKGNMSFSGEAPSGFTLPLGTDSSVGGDNDGFRPMELMALSIAACTAMDVISILKKKRQQVTGFEVRVLADRAADHPKVFTHVNIEYLITGVGVDPAAVERAIELSATTYCPAQAMVAASTKIDHKYVINEAAAA